MEVIVGIDFHFFQFDDTLFSAFDDGRVDVGPIDERTVIKSGLVEQDSDGVGLFSGGTAGTPCLDVRKGGQVGDDFFAYGFVICRVAEHFGDGDRHFDEKLVEKIGRIYQVVFQRSEVEVVNGQYTRYTPL